MGPRNPDEPIGEFFELAFVENQNFQESEQDAARSRERQQEEILDKKLEQQDKKLIKVHLKTMIDNRSKLAIDMHNEDTIGQIIQRVAVKKARELNPKKYIILEYNEGQQSGQIVNGHGF